MVAVSGLVKENIVVLSSSKSSDDGNHLLYHPLTHSHSLTHSRLERDVQHSLLQMAIQSGKMDEDVSFISVCLSVYLNCFSSPH